jgi:beta-galactosidase
MKIHLQTLLALPALILAPLNMAKATRLKPAALELQLILIFLLCSLGFNTRGSEPVRVKGLFDFDWRFAGGDVAGAEKPEFDDTSWMPVDLPHDFAIYGPFDEKVAGGGPNGYRPLGIGWYRKNFSTPANLAGKKVWLDFEGIYRAPKVWINGILVAERLNGYVGFQCDITTHLRPAGQTNIVAVRADNSVPQTSRWYTGGGIYRHVWLISTGEVHVVQHGTYVTTPKITEQEAWVNIQTEVKNETATNRWTTLISEILDPDCPDPLRRNLHHPPAA